jgi:hypothetical protein
MNVRKTVRIASVGCVLLLPLIVSCGASVKMVNQDPSFTAANFADGGLAILGCTTVVVPDSDDLVLSDRYCGSLRQEIKEKQKGVEVGEWGSVRQMLGDETILKCLKEYHDLGTLEPATLESLKGPLAENWRYVLVHRIESDQLKFSQEVEKSKMGGELGSVTTGYALGTERIISVTFSIYDLEDAKRMTETTIESSKGKSHEIGLGQSSNIGGVVGTVIDVDRDLDGIFKDRENPISKFPWPPSQDDIVNRIYARFAIQLPARR